MSNAIPFSDYRKSIQIDQSITLGATDEWRALVIPVLQQLGVEVSDNCAVDEGLEILRGVLAPIDPGTLADELIERVEQIATGVNHSRDTVEPLGLSSIAENLKTTYPAADQTSIWVGDITTIATDAIVNAANAAMLGCRIPNHPCIDNAIHSAAGPRLREDCAVIMDRQQSLEPVGMAKLTRGYALPSRFVLHTVGPQLRAGSLPTETDRSSLVSSYQSCLNIAAEVESIRTVAFCAISTGLFAYPIRDAAHVALSTVAGWLQEHPDRFDRVVFNLFTPADAAVYEAIVRDWE